MTWSILDPLVFSWFVYIPHIPMCSNRFQVRNNSHRFTHPVASRIRDRHGWGSTHEIPIGPIVCTLLAKHFSRSYSWSCFIALHESENSASRGPKLWKSRMNYHDPSTTTPSKFQTAPLWAMKTPHIPWNPGWPTHPQYIGSLRQ